MRKIRIMIARAIMFMVDEHKDTLSSYSPEENIQTAEAIKTLTEAIKNLR